jgi:hypothetical protein
MNLNCLRCKRTLVWGELYADGYTDDDVLCHACKKARNEELEAELKEYDDDR